MDQAKLSLQVWNQAALDVLATPVAPKPAPVVVPAPQQVAPVAPAPAPVPPQLAAAKQPVVGTTHSFGLPADQTPQRFGFVSPAPAPAPPPPAAAKQPQYLSFGLPQDQPKQVFDFSHIA